MRRSQRQHGSSVRRQSSTDSPAAPKIRSRLNVVEAGLADQRDRARHRVRVVLRPSAASTCGAIDCTPSEIRVTPPARYAASSAGVTVSGLHSTVTSAPSARGIASRTATSSSAGSSDGVPPPKKTEVAAPRPSATAPPISRRQRGGVVGHQVVAVGPRRERAVVAAARAERDVDVDAERGRRSGSGGDEVADAATYIFGRDAEQQGQRLKVLGRNRMGQSGSARRARITAR